MTNQSPQNYEDERIELLRNVEYRFPPVSGKIIQGYPESYTWIISYLAFREKRRPITMNMIDEKLQTFRQPNSAIAHRFRGALLGLAVGDAIGTTNEFLEPGTFPHIDGLVGGGPFNLKQGQWTDDTSMAYALGQSLIYRQGFDAHDQMDKYIRWWEHGIYSCTGRCFDIGNTVSAALKRYQTTGDPFAGSTDPYSAGNGSLMRLAPVILYFLNNVEDVLFYAGESSRTTHAAPEAVSACQYFAALLHGAINGMDKESLLSADFEPYEGAWNCFPLAKKVIDIRCGDYLEKKREALRPTGYVIDSLEAALWCFAHSESYREGVLLAANLGGDADTIAAIFGQIAGAYYGEPGIPAEWIYDLAYRHIFFIQAHKMLDHAELI